MHKYLFHYIDTNYFICESFVLCNSLFIFKVVGACSLVRFHTALCKSQGLLSRSRTLLYDVLFSKHIKALPVVFTMLTSWSEILPHSSFSEGK
jgi:hypothetical protein